MRWPLVAPARRALPSWNRFCIRVRIGCVSAADRGSRPSGKQESGAVPGDVVDRSQPRSEAMKKTHPRARHTLLPVVAAVAALAGWRRRRRRPRATARRPPSRPRPRSTAPTSTCSTATSRPPRPRLRHAGRQLPAAAGRVRRAELLQARPERAVRDPHRQQRRRQGRHHVPVPLQQHAEGQDAGDRPGRQHQGRGDPADPVRARCRRPTRPRSTSTRPTPSTWSAATAAPARAAS